MSDRKNIVPIELPEGCYYNTTQVAQLRGVVVKTVGLWIQRGWLPAVRAGTIGWLVEAKTLAAFRPPPHGPRTSDSPYGPAPKRRKR